MTTLFPLSAIVGQEELIEALLINAVAPEVGGVLVRGERGTAKSTAVRGLAPLLPPVTAASGQAFAFAPGELAPGGPVPADAPVAARPARLVELPLGTTLDRLVGALDLARALAGEHAFEAGLLARAHQGILYVDEVNLLPDHLVDALLDAAASGVARVERDAVSVAHAARFLLVGTMNVEEGELRPQLTDRFGLGVEVRAPSDPSARAEIVRRRLAFESDPEGFRAAWAASERSLADRIAAARTAVAAVRLPERELMRITGACARLGVDGVRGDIVCAWAARALAALDGADEVTEEHVRRAAPLALSHRRRRDPLDGRAPDDEELERALDGPSGEDEPPPEEGPDGGQGRADRSDGPDGADRSHVPDAADRSHGPDPTDPTDGPDPTDLTDGPDDTDPTDRPPPTDPAHPSDARPRPDVPARPRHDPPAPARLPVDALALAGAGSGPTGRRARGGGPGAGAIDSRPAAPGTEDIALVATLRARLLGAAKLAAQPSGATVKSPGASSVGSSPGGGHPGSRDLREHVRAGREGAFLCLVVDASGSMGARRRLARVKGALLAVLREAYARRDRVAVIVFRDSAAELLIAPGAPLERAAEALRALPTGGRTPIAAGLDLAERLIRREAGREAGRRAIAVVLTDGRAADRARTIPAAAARLGRAAAAVHVIDTEDGPVRLGLAAEIATAAGGEVHRLAPAPPRRAA
jgi:magnesium chelatase subunit D